MASELHCLWPGRHNSVLPPSQSYWPQVFSCNHDDEDGGGDGDVGSGGGDDGGGDMMIIIFTMMMMKMKQTFRVAGQRSCHYFDYSVAMMMTIVLMTVAIMMKMVVLVMLMIKVVKMVVMKQKF